jgi:hypothetical protein
MTPAKIALFLIGGLVIVIAIFFELGSGFFLVGNASDYGDVGRPGIGIRYLATLDLLLLYTLILLATDFIPVLRAVAARLQGIVTFVLSLLGLLALLGLIIVALGLLVTMVTLLLAVPFGTIAYLALWGSFDVEKAAAFLGMVMAMKLIGLLLIVAGNLTFIKNKGFMLLIGCSLGMTFLLGFLLAFPPGILASITDAIGALIAGVIALIWAVIFLIGAIPAVVNAIRSLIPRPS